MRFYRNWFLAPLTSLASSKVKFEWYPIINRLLRNQSAYWNWGIVILSRLQQTIPYLYWCIWSSVGCAYYAGQKSIAFYSRKCNTNQRRYATSERVLLSTIETSKEYKNIFLDYPIVALSEHKNNIFNGLKASNHVYAGFYYLRSMG